ncbi:exopolysaccharide biosynthesis protein [Phenylobacterium sp. J367]|uniref:exopolysaccharide biosynthesis protein n=1 Tax=Phenylobacterium sp. J367 TaxID=2898435 RepID=UPI00215095E0|nr:exopolysaccharide biosynthesis protein [Phenylobacterium sp. J367]MCR5879475.1 exopolysaccharide biosynthesis protein [Phenylobacterium sp. J367]
MVVFAAPLVLPMPPGVSAVLGLPLLLFSAQFMLGMRRPWLPGALADRAIRGRDVKAMAERVVPMLLRIERLLHPRLTFLAHGPFARLVGVVAFVLSVIVFLPVPFGNILPSLAIAVLGLGLVERDGLALLIGGAVAGASLALLAWLGHVVFDAGVGLLAFAGAFLA